MITNFFNRISTLIAATFLVHAGIFATTEIYGRVAPFNDVLLYGWWLFNLPTTDLLGISTDWVYPYPALAPMLVAMFLGLGQNILLGWVILVFALNLLAVGQLTRWGKGTKAQFAAAWFWLAFITALGPVAIARIDSIATAIAALGLIALSKNKISQAMMLFTLGAWVKIWPVALGLALFVSRIGRKQMATAALIVVGAVFAVGLALGGDLSLLSFVTTQGNRGIQIEAPIATIWLWAAKLGVPGAGIYFDQAMLTNQVSGGGVAQVSQLMSLAMLVAVSITAFLGWRAFRAGADANKLVAAIALTAVLDLIVFNKVGSPQFIGWLAVPIMAAVLFNLQNFKVPMVAGLGLAAITYLIYPVFYLDLMGLGWLSISLLTIRNLGLIALLVWANRSLASLAKRPELATQSELGL